MSVHRPHDSCLFTQEIEDNPRQLAALFPVVNAALASLSAYATASGPPAQSIAAVVVAFAAADDALHQRYAHSIDAWRAQLVALKDLEDDLAAVLRNRDILVGTRLLKASKSTLGVSASLLSSDTEIATTPFAFEPGSTNTKLAQAKAELQACEAQLVAKERELDARRIAVAHDGLGARCRALVDCAAMWSEMGKQGLRALQACQGDRQHDGSLVVNSSASSTPAPTPLSTHLAYPSDSTSQIAARSTEASVETPSSKQDANPHAQSANSRSELKPQPESEVQLAQKPKPNADADVDVTLTIAFPLAHPIPELAVSTDVPSRSPSSDAHSAPAPATQQPPVSKTTSTPSSAPLPSRKNTRYSCRPPSQYIAEVSDESSASHHRRCSRSNVNATADATKTDVNTTLPALDPQSLLPQVCPTCDTSCCSDESDESNDGYYDPSDEPFQTAENDSIEAIQQSMVISPGASVVLMPVRPNTTTDGSVPPNAPSPLVLSNAPRARTGSAISTSARASASAPDVRTSVQDPVAGSASKFLLGPDSASGLGLDWDPVSGPLAPAQPQSAERERRTSLAFFGSLQGLFRKASKDQQQQQKRGRGAVAQWEDSDGCGSAEPYGWVSTGTRVGVNWRRGAGGGRGGGWIARTDTQTRGERHPDEDSDVQPIATTSAAAAATSKTILTVADVGQRGSRLPKGRSGAFVGLPSIRRRQGHGSGNGNGSLLSIPVDVSTTVQVDGWVTDEPVAVGTGSRMMNMASGMGMGAATEISTGVTGPGKSRMARRSMTKRHQTSVAHLRGSDHSQSDGEMIVRNGGTRAKSNTNPGPGAPLPRHAATTRHRNSTSMFEVDVPRAMLSSLPTPSQTPPVPCGPPTRTPSSTSSSSPISHARGQAQVDTERAHKRQLENQSLMSMVADVTSQHPHSRQDGDKSDAMWSFNVPRVSASSVLNREVVEGRDRSSVQEVRGIVGRRLGIDMATTTMNSREHGRATSTRSTESGRLNAEQGQARSERPVKMPLRSALRKSSRTPSAGPVTVEATPVVRTTTTATGAVVPRGARPRGVEADSDERNQVRRSCRDPASVASYVAGRENWDDEVMQSRVPSSTTPSGSRSRLPTPQVEPSFTILPPPPPPPVEPPVTGNGHAHPDVDSGSNRNSNSNVNVRSSMVQLVRPFSTVSTEKDTKATATKARRKSVRLSLKPTFLPAPPALFDEDGEKGTRLGVGRFR